MSLKMAYYHTRSAMAMVDVSLLYAGLTTRWGWQIDMFAGYASTTPALWAMMEYDGMVIRWEGRDDEMQFAWTAERAYQFHWHPSAVLSANRSSMFTHIINGSKCSRSLCVFLRSLKDAAAQTTQRRCTRPRPCRPLRRRRTCA